MKRGRTVIRGSRSFSVTKEGTQKYTGKAKSYIWEVELEAPVGTDATYIAPKAKSRKYKNKFIEQMETIVKDGTECEIIEVIDTKKEHKVILRAIV